MKALIRGILSRIPGVRFWVAKRIFLGLNSNFTRFLGVFPTFAKAKAHIPKGQDEESDAAKLFQNFPEEIRHEDFTVVRILSGLMPEIKTIFDLGGNNGVCFYLYRTQIKYPATLRWTVCDVPSVIEAGRQLARERGETQIDFTDDRRAGSGTDVYLTSGTLQYLEEPFAVLLAELKDKPRHILVNRVPMTERSAFYTLQNTGHSIHPYYVPNLTAFVASIEALGYRVVEEWKNDRSCDIILRPGQFVRNYHGFYFVRS